MDQGSYSRPDGRGQPSLSGSSASNNNYQVNVSRQKTKKWVEAKSQNYDGDDWGADEYDDDEVAPPLPLSPHGPQYGAPPGAPHVPSLHIQTNPPPQPQPAQQHQPYPPPQSRAPPPATAQPRQESNTPLPAHPSSAAPPSAGGFAPQSASSTYPLSPRSPPDSLPSNTPQAATAGKPLPFVRPSDIYRRMEDEKSRGSSESSRPSADYGSSLSKQTSASPARTAAQPVKPQPPTAPIPAPRTDSHTSIYQDLTKPTVSQAPQQPLVTSPRAEPRVSEFVTPSRDATPNTTSEDAKRLSTSPKLPDLARMSVFGADFFSSGFSSTLSSEQIAEQNIPEVPKVAPELKVDKPTTYEESASPAEASKAATDKTQTTPAAPAAMEDALIKHEIIAPTVYQPPAVTARNTEPVVPLSPTESKPAADHAKQVAARSSTDTASSSHSAVSATEITPTKPLNVRKDESPVRAFEPPPPLQREPTFGTDTSSPVKESDALRDEIIKTLNSPSQPSREGSETKPADSGRKGSQGHARDSTYTLQDYDSYWEDTDAAPKVPAQPVQPQTKTMSIVPEETTQAVAAATPETPIAKAPEPWKPIEEAKPAAPLPAVNSAAATEATPRVSTGQSSASPTVSQVSKSTSAQQHPEASIVSPVSADLRRRFSWEAEDASKQPPAAASAAPAGATISPSTPAAVVASTPTPATATASPSMPAPIAAPALAVAAAAVAPAEPKAQPELTSPRASEAPAPNAASIPAVAATDSNSQESKRLSLADEKGLSATTSNEGSAPHDEHPALRLSDPAPAPVLSMPKSSGASVTQFKDIVALNNSSERVAKFNETRVAFAVMDIGLDKWLKGLHQDHPEHHSKSFNSYQPSAAVPAGAPAGAQAPAQQPYYQQYLNASTPGSGSSPGRRIGGITMPSNASGSTFGHSGNQIGTKSKELMQSAGKMGKGLFSKGKNKLRGDKGDTHPPPVQAKTRHDRSGSWAVLSNKLRTEFSPRDPGHSQHPEEEYPAAPRPSVTIAPQIPEPEPVSPLLREASPDKSLPPVQTQPAARDNALATASLPTAAPTTSHVPSSSQIRIVPAETTHGPFSAEAPAVPPNAAEDSGVGMLAQPDESGDFPKRQSSFVGLPPIRRSSTFGLKSKARRAAERFPIDEEEGNDVPDLPTSDVMENAVRQAEAAQQPHREQPAVTPAGPSFPALDKDSVIVQHQPVSPEHSPERLARQPATVHPPQAQPMRQPAQPPMLMHPGQSGPWKLEESHLAEPLHQAKNRSGHSPISSPMGYGFDKETGNSAAMAPPPVPAGMRQRTPDVPPSSAQRWPGLFAPQPGQEPPQQQTTQQPYYEEVVNPRHSINEYSIPGVGPPTEERGRAKRNSGIFKEIGDKIARATSRDRKNSFAENRPPVDMHTDGASESSFGTEEMTDRRKRRSSFLNTLTGRTSVDQGRLRQSFNALQRSETETFPASSVEDVGSTRKRSMFGGVMAGFGANKGGSANAPASGFVNQQVTDDEPQLTPKKKRFSAFTKAFQRPNQDRPSSGMSLEPTQSAGSSQGQIGRSGMFSSIPFRNNDRGGSAGQMDSAAPEHSRRASFSNLLSTLAGNKGQQHEQQSAPPPKDMGGMPPKDLPQNIPAAPPQAHPADGFPAPHRGGAAAPILADQFLDRSQPLFAAGESNWGMNRPPTSTTVTGSEAKADAGESIASRAAIAPDAGHLPLPAIASAKHDDPVAPSEISDSETDYAENIRKPSDVTPSVTSRGDDEIGDMTRQDTNISQMTPSIVTDGPRLNSQQQTPTAQYPNSPGGYFTQNNRMPGAGPLSAGAQGYSQGQSFQHPGDPRRSLTGPGHGQSMGQSSPGAQYGQRIQQPAQYANQQQQQPQRYMQPSLSQPVSRAQGAAASSKGWKGLKTKMASQMASMSQPPPNSKSERGDKPAPGDKLFNAFKRLSKQQGSAEAQQQGAAPSAAHAGLDSTGSHLHARNQGQPAVGQPQQMPHQYMQHQQMPPQQMHMRQGFHPGQGPPQQQVPTYMQQHQHQQHQQPQTEPQYGAVPIPQGYTAVYGHGSSQVPSMYNVGRQHSQHQTPYQQQQTHPDHYQTYSAVDDNQQQGNGAAAAQVQSPRPPQPETQAESHPHEYHSHRPSATGSELLSPASTTQRSGSMAMSPVSDEPRSPHAALTREALAQQDAHKDLQVHHLHPDEGRTSLGPSNSNRVSQVSNDSGRHGPSPKSEHSPAVSHKQLQAVVSPASPDNEPHVSAAKASPPAGSGSDVASPRNGAAAVPDEAIIIPATLTSDLTGESKGHVSDDSLEKQAKLSKTTNTITAATEHFAELEDTAEARKRTLRIDGQEEKIAYDPEEENPKMTATSYPGQEWNPYGEPGFGEWQE
ncbi:hypothetical protein LEL_06945 [Akanthomyces lecanii RCEF 1005]|uniref:SWI-SNF chromatin-remodeling complex protein n=1 Tax=Akanthomyces lecanii RCEF 1005 TaxID=1081108 RepID=A0A168FC00_CORDF|nr:hypothetical protein LEL_06945 [Akanthomyces lecanii RCEF 1005]